MLRLAVHTNYVPVFSSPAFSVAPTEPLTHSMRSAQCNKPQILGDTHAASMTTNSISDKHWQVHSQYQRQRHSRYYLPTAHAWEMQARTKNHTCNMLKGATHI